MMRPGTTIGDAAPNGPATQTGLQMLTSKRVIAAPPLLAGGVNDTVACALPAIALAAVGAPGSVAGVTVFDAPEAGPVPTMLAAVTVKVYAVPLVRPEMLRGTVRLPALVSTPPGGLDVTVKPEIAGHVGSEHVGAVNVTDACALPAVAVAAVGAGGTVVAGLGVTLLDGAEAGPVPTLLLAVTVKVCDKPFVRLPAG